MAKKVVSSSTSENTEEKVSSYGLAVRAIQRDRLVAKLLEQSEGVQVPSKRLTAEVRGYVLSSVDLETSQPKFYGIDGKFENPLQDIRKISKVILDIQAYRDRIVTIIGELREKQFFLIERKRKGYKYVKDVYAKTIKAQGTQRNQEEFIESVLWPIVEKRSKIEDLISRIELVAKNLDNAWFSYKRVNENCETLQGRMESRGGREYR